MRKKYLTQLLSALSRSRWQFIIAGSLALAYLINGQGLYSPDESERRHLMIFMAMLGSMLALMTSLSFSFLIQFMNATDNRKHDLFAKLKAELFNFDSFLKDYPPHLPIINESKSFSWELKTIKYDEFPILDWDERFDGLNPHIGESRGIYEEDRNLENKILGYLVIMEDIVSDIGLMCIRQITYSLHAERAIKGFACLAGVLVSAVVTFYASSDNVLFLLSSAPIFFSVMVLLYILELGWNLKREADEALIFVEQETDA